MVDALPTIRVLGGDTGRAVWGTLLESRPGKSFKLFLDAASQPRVLFQIDQKVPEVRINHLFIVADDYGPSGGIGPRIQNTVEVFHEVRRIEVLRQEQSGELDLKPDSSRNVVDDTRLGGQVDQAIYKSVFSICLLCHFGPVRSPLQQLCH